MAARAWTPPDWRGLTVVCVASGPSAKSIDLTPAKDRARIIAINEGWRLCPWADLLYGCDGTWWTERRPSAEAFAGERVTQDLHAAEALGLARVSVERVDRILTAHPGVIGSGGNGGFQAINLAVQAGARRIVLVGYDYRLDLGHHWHGRHPFPLNNPRPSTVPRWREALDGQAGRLKALGVTVINASPVSALTAFPKLGLPEALDGDRDEPDVSTRRDVVAAV